MHLTSVRLREFRNFADQRIDLPPAGIALIGDNGQGKTNLLEAIYYLEIFRSFRGAPDEQLVRFGGDVFHIHGSVEGDEAPPRTVSAAYDRRARRKKVTVNGAEPARIGDALGSVGAVIFSPADVSIVAGAPGERRRFIDIVLSLTVPGYLHAIQRYRQVLTRRNSLLRQGAPRAQVDAWNHGLAGWGSRVMEMRAEWVESRTGSFSAHVGAISDGAEAVLEYEASVDIRAPGAAGGAAATEAFLAELERVADREERRGMTLLGPHRDDLRIRARSTAAGWVDLRTYGSGGQQRTAAVALRMIEAESVRDAVGWDPIILLDDVFAELDPGRSRRILEWVEKEEGGQVILTAPKPSDFEVRGGSLERWTVHRGILSRL